MPLTYDLLLFLCWTFLKNYVNRNWSEKNNGHKGTPWPCPLLDALFFLYQLGHFLASVKMEKDWLLSLIPRSTQRAVFWRNNRDDTSAFAPSHYAFKSHPTSKASQQCAVHITHFPTTNPFVRHSPASFWTAPALSHNIQSITRVVTAGSKFWNYELFKSIPEAFIAWGSQPVLMRHVVNLHTIT